MTALAVSILCLTALAAAFMQGASGIGFALIFAPVAGFLEPTLLPVTLLGLMIPLNLYVLLLERGHVDFRGVAWISMARILCTPLGVWLLVAVPSNMLGVLIGGSTVAAAAVSLLAPSFAPGRVAYLAAGAVTGVSETATGIGGPPLALVYQHRPAPELRATLALCFLIGEVVSLIMLWFEGDIPAPSLSLVGMLLVALAAGLWLSSLVHHRISNTMLRTIVLVFSLVSGLVLMVAG